LLKKDVLFHTGGKQVRQIQISNVEKLWREGYFQVQMTLSSAPGKTFP
jgi:hypothetical protein